MLIAAALCPHPLLLVPAATGASGQDHTELQRLRTACHAAVATLCAVPADLIVVVGGAERTAEYAPEASGHLHEFGIPFAVGDPGYPAVLPLSLTIGKWLLSESAPRTAWWTIAADAPTGECLDLGAKLATLAPRVALLVMGDGPGRRARAAPGAVDAAADRYDAQVTAALAAPSPGALGALDPAQDPELFVAGRAAWQVLAGAAGRGSFDAALEYAAAPFEVTYFVATWRRAY